MTHEELKAQASSLPPQETEKAQQIRIPLSVPTPTADYRTHRKALRMLTASSRLSALPQPLPTPSPVPIPPLPRLKGPRVLIWKQDPTVAEIGIRLAWLPHFVLSGPKDFRIAIQGLPTVSANAMGDFVQTPGTEAFDAVHTFAVVRMALTMVQRALGGTPVPWHWNSASNTDPITVFPRAAEGMNAFYSRSARQLQFLFFRKPGTPPGPPDTFTCRSFDIVSHETGHAILDGLRPGWLGFGNPPQTGGLHESFGDLLAIFLALSQMDQVDAVIAQTKANLHDKTFLADVAEEFGLALGRPNGLRNADNDLKLSEVGNQVHAISQVFTGAIYDILADIFSFERKPSQKDDTQVLYEAAQYLFSLLIRAIKQAPASAATFADVANGMMTISQSDGKPNDYRNFITNRFAVREVVLVPAFSLSEEVRELEPAISESPSTPQDRRFCCGTMQSAEFNGAEEAMKEELEELKASFMAAGAGS